MLKKTVNYKNLDNHDIVEDMYFNLTEAEAVKLQMQMPGGLDKFIQNAISSNDGGKIIEAFEMLVKASYGRRTADAKFVKKQEYFDEFVTTDAYSQFFMGIVTDAEKAADFFNGIMPADLLKRIQAAELVSESVVTPNEAREILLPETRAEYPDGDSVLNEAAFAEVDKGEALKTTDKNVPKEMLVIKMAIKAGNPVKLTQHRIQHLSEAELEKAIENGSTVE